MKNHSDDCLDKTMKKALQEERVIDIAHCLLNCFQEFKFSIFKNRITPDEEYDFFWKVLTALNNKSKREKIPLTTTVCGYFYGCVRMIWRGYWKNRKKGMTMVELSVWDEPDLRTPVIIHLEKEKTEAMNNCISKMDERGQKIIEAYLDGEKDVDIYQQFGLGNPRGLAVIRKRCFDKLKKCLQDNYPDLF